MKQRHPEQRKRRVPLGFQVLAATGELQGTTEAGRNAKRADKEYRSHELAKARKLRWWRKNADRLNARRRAAARSVAGRYEEAKRRAIARGDGWSFTPDEWERAWIEAGWVLVPGTATTQNPLGTIVPAFALRGNHVYKNTCMQRIDTTKEWSVDNTTIMFRGKVLDEKNEWYRPPHRDAKQQ